jgi:hypothetical protein
MDNCRPVLKIQNLLEGAVISQTASANLVSSVLMGHDAKYAKQVIIVQAVTFLWHARRTQQRSWAVQLSWIASAVLVLQVLREERAAYVIRQRSASTARCRTAPIFHMHQRVLMICRTALANRDITEFVPWMFLTSIRQSKFSRYVDLVADSSFTVRMALEGRCAQSIRWRLLARCQS